MQKNFGFIGVMVFTASLLACAPAPTQPAAPDHSTVTTQPVMPTPPTEPAPPVMTAPTPAPTTSEPSPPVVTEPSLPVPPASAEPTPPTPPVTPMPPVTTEPTPPLVVPPTPPATTEPTPPTSPATTPTPPTPPATTEPTTPTPPISSVPVNVLPVSYTATVGDKSYLDDTGKQLTDTVLGGDLFNAKITGVAAYEWIGWANKDASLSFEFNQERKFSKIRIGFNHNETAGILLPKNVIINGQAFPLKGNEVPNLKRGFVTFDVNFNATTVGIKLERNPSRQWMMVDEIRFEAR
jgi:hypothetical protein